MKIYARFATHHGFKPLVGAYKLIVRCLVSFAVKMHCEIELESLESYCRLLAGVIIQMMSGYQQR